MGTIIGAAMALVCVSMALINFSDGGMVVGVTCLVLAAFCLLFSVLSLLER